MKKIVYIIVSFMFLLPCMVNAETYENTKDIVNKYILNTTYRGTYQKYLLTNTSNYYIDGESEGFDKGGLINYKEFLITQNRKSPMFSYLYDGYNYWTYTKSGNKRYLVSNINDVVVNESDTTPKVRVTEYVKQDAKVEGSGTISDPWIFVPSYEVNITTNEYGSISIRKNNDCTKGSSIKEVDLTYIKGDALDICIIPNNGYVYVSNNCDNFLTLSSSKEYLTLKNVTKDINCKIYFNKSSNKITLEQTNAELTSLPTEIYLIYSQGWYKDKEATTQISSLDRVPKRTGYNFNGYTHQKTDGTTLEIINSSGKIITNENTLKAFESAGSLKINWKVKTTNVTLDNQGGTVSESPITATYDSAMPTITPPTRAGYKFEGYYYGTNGSGTKYYNADGTSANKWNIDSENTTLYAYWKANTYTITFDRQPSTNGTSTITATYDSDMPTITIPTRTGYTFNGYYTETNGSGTKYYNANGTSANKWNITSNKTLYAYWTANTYTITFDRQPSTNGTSTTTATYNSDMPTITIPTRTGYLFQGYYTETSGNGTKYYNANGTSANKWNITSDKTLYAYWKMDRIACADLNNVIQCKTTDTSKIINFTGTCSYVCENTSLNNFKIKFLTSGTLTINNSLNIDAFLVGGGGGGNTSDTGVGGAGGGGYAKTIKNITLSSGTYVITIGAGGGRGAKGGTTSIKQNGSIINGLVAAGGNGGGAGGGYIAWGGSGGSAGGGFSDANQGTPLCHGRFGNNGSSAYGQINHPGPNGETGSTCEFGQGTTSGCNSGVAEYSGGGCCGCCCTVGGGGGSCGGGNGTANTGGGGGAYYLSTGKGGSGIVIIRNKR